MEEKKENPLFMYSAKGDTRYGLYLFQIIAKKKGQDLHQGTPVGSFLLLEEAVFEIKNLLGAKKYLFSKIAPQKWLGESFKIAKRTEGIEKFKRKFRGKEGWFIVSPRKETPELVRGRNCDWSVLGCIF